MKGGYREIWGVAWPLLLSQASFVVMQFSDRIMLSRYGSAEIEAALPSGLLAFTILCFFQAVASYAGTFTAQYTGAGDPVNAAKAGVQGIWIGVLGSLPLLALIPAGCALIDCAGHPSGVALLEKRYFRILMAGGLVYPVNAALCGYFTGVLRTRIPFIANLLSCVLNIFLNAVLIFGKFGFQARGIEGAAYATVLAEVAMLLFLSAVSICDPGFRAARSCGRAVWLVPDFKMVGRILRFGAPSGFKLVLDMGAYTVFTMVTGRFGEVAFAASNIAMSINNLAFAPLLGFGMAAGTVVARYQGAREPAIAERAGNRCLLMGFAYMMVVGLSFLVLARPYFSIFKPGGSTIPFPELFAYGRVMLLIMAAWGLFDTVNIVLEQALAGAGDTRFIMAYVFVTNWIVLMPGIVLLLFLGVGIVGLWIWFASYIALASAGLWFRWQKGRWKTIRLIA
ncbi:MAG: MATE family efflux transporter [Kiritimatiellae bacterium]|nr:MATE family efflux transporter [Kiritimatiellia bacterium]